MDTINDQNENDKTTSEPGDEIGEKSGEASETIAEDAPATIADGLRALDVLREKHGSEGADPKFAEAFDKIAKALREGPSERADEGDDEPPTSRMTPPAQSRFALRDDGVLLLSLEGANDRDLNGRTVIPFMAITADEGARAREVLDFALSDAAAQVIGALPMKVLQ